MDPDFVYIIYIRTTPEALWRALTDGEFTKRYWSGTRIESSWEVGAPFRLWSPLDPAEAERRGMTMNGQGEALSDIGEVLVCDPPRALAYSWSSQWDAQMRADPPSQVRFDLAPAGEAVKLTITHDRLAARPEVLASLREGWSGLASGLKSLLETGQVLEIHMAPPEPVE